MSINIEDLEFAATLTEDGSCKIEIIYRLGDMVESTFVDVEELKSAIKFLETEVNR